MNHRFKALCFGLVAWLCVQHISAQDSTHLTIPQANNIFAQKNLYALAARLRVDEQKAQEIQARLYPNPILSAELNAYNPQRGKAFDNGSNGQKALAIEQLVLLGGKRKNSRALASLQTQQAQYELEALLRELLYQLHVSMYSVYFDQLTIRKYDQQLDQLDSLVTAYEVQAHKGNIALKEVVRLKSLFIRLNNDKTELMLAIQEEQKTLQLLLQTQAYVVPDLPDALWEKLEHLPMQDTLLALALQQRADLKLSGIHQQTAAVNLQLQRSLAMPDVSVGASYDQQGGAYRNQLNVTLGLPLPLWNRNQGNIKSAHVATQVAAVQYQTRQAEVTAEVNSAWHNMRRSIQEYQKVKQVYNSDFNDVLTGITENFRKRNISIIEFVDFYESYNETVAEVNRIRKQLALSAENINTVISSPYYQ